MVTRSSLIRRILLVALVVVPGLLLAQSGSDSQGGKKPDWVNTVAEVAPDPTDASALALRKIRSSAFDDRTGSKRTLDAADDGHGYGMAVDYVRIPPLPVSESQIVLIGHVTALSGASSITLPQLGGALRLPSGKVIKQFVPADEKLLDVGARYVLFLDYDAKHDWFGVVKAWELQNGRAKARAQTDVKDAAQGISRYDGMDESQFLLEVQSAVNGIPSH
jgi:hypothetical protein